MIVLENLTKVYRLNGRRKIVANAINATIPSGVSVGLLGRNGAGKSTLLKLIAGTTHPTSGRVLTKGTVSFPVGLASALHPDLTGAQNTRFVARIYGADTDALTAYVETFSELGEHFHLPVRSYSSGMRGRLSFGINMGLDFDTYLVDEVTAVGDASFRKKSRDVFLDRMKNAGAIFVSHSMGTIREMCSAGAYLENGELHYYQDIEDAIDRYVHSLNDGKFTSVRRPETQIEFPYDASMLFGLGQPHTRFDWVGDCLRRHRPCHFSKAREPHYFDTRSGHMTVIADRRLKTVQQLATRVQTQTGEDRQNTLRLLGDITGLAAIHSAPETGQDRHTAYLDYLLDGRKTKPIVCDFTPSYALLDTESFAEMAQIGAARFVCVLRDPAQRLWAQIWHGLPATARNEAAAVKAARAIISAPETLGDFPEADYVSLFSRLDKAALPERVLWLFHEDLTGREAIRTLCDFLDIPNVPTAHIPPLPQDTEAPLPTDIETELRKLLASQYEAARLKFGDRLPLHWGVRHKQVA